MLKFNLAQSQLKPNRLKVTPPKPERSQEYYDAVAKELESGMIASNPRTGNVIYTTTSESFVGKDCNNKPLDFHFDILV